MRLLWEFTFWRGPVEKFKKDYAKPELKSQKIELGVFGSYNWEPPNEGEWQPFDWTYGS